MTLAEFYALRASPQAIIVPRVRARAARRAAEAVAAARSDAKTTISVLPEKGSADKKH